MIERILSHQQSKLLSNDEMMPVSAASICTWGTQNPTHLQSS